MANTWQTCAVLLSVILFVSFNNCNAYTGKNMYTSAEHSLTEVMQKENDTNTTVYEAIFTFQNDEFLEELNWTVNPLNYSTGKDGLVAAMQEKTDFWQKTYYKPPFMNDNGHILYKEISDEYILMETFFDLQPMNQFDQAGLAVRLDKEHWIKAGIEYVDGKYQLGCVVTNNYSDWSVQEVPTAMVGLRIYREGCNFVIEAKVSPEEDWKFIRICHLNVGKTQTVKMGLLMCAPTDAGGQVVFSRLVFKENPGYDHQGQSTM